MMKRFAAHEFSFFTPQQNSEKLEERNCYIPLNGTTGVTLMVRSKSPVTVSAITAEGETVYIDQGLALDLQLRLDGFSAVEILATDTFAYQCSIPTKWWEIPDPTRLVVTVDEPSTKPMDDLIREGIAKHLGKLQAQGILNDAELEELLDDVYNGEHDFDQEPDEFGLGHVEETEEELQMAAEQAEKRSRKPAKQKPAVEDTPLPLEGSHEAQKPAGKPAPKESPDPDA